VATRRHPREADTVQGQFARKLRELRLSRNMSQMDLVRDHGWSLSHYQKLERGTIDPRLTTIVALAEALEIPLRDFLDFAPTPRRR
jgi:transcriptional regulator with XRE-family HTH domain